MKTKQLNKRNKQLFEVLLETRAAQAAFMTLRPGNSSDDEPRNEHPHSEQWLWVLAGSGQARVGKTRRTLRTIPLRKNSLLVVNKGEHHQITNTGRVALETFNVYVPPAYKLNGELRSR